MSDILLSPRTYDRIARVVDRGVGTMFPVGGGPAAVVRADPVTLQVQSGAATDSGYPARRRVKDLAAGTWADYDDTEVRVIDPDGRPLSAGEQVEGRPVGDNADGVMCYVTRGGETAALTVLSTAAVGGLYPAVRRIQSGRAATWPAAELCWAEPLNGGTLTARTYVGRRNVDQYLGRDVWAVDDCCRLTGSGSGSECESCPPEGWPVEWCVTVALDDGACGCVPAEYTFRMTGGWRSSVVFGGGPCAYYSASVAETNGCLYFGVATLWYTEGEGWTFILSVGDLCNSQFEIQETWTDATPYDCSGSVTLTFTTTLNSTGQYRSDPGQCIPPADPSCVGKPVTITVQSVAAGGACGGGGGGGGSTVGAACCPDGISTALWCTLDAPGVPDIDGQSIAVDYQASGNYWIGSATFAGVQWDANGSCGSDGTWHAVLDNGVGRCTLFAAGPVQSCTPFSATVAGTLTGNNACAWDGQAVTLVFTPR